MEDYKIIWDLLGLSTESKGCIAPAVTPHLGPIKKASTFKPSMGVEIT
jgi:hypothetical protein